MIDWTLIGVGAAVLIGLLTAWGSLWFKMGKVTTEVKGHNKRMDDFKEALDAIKGDVNQRIDDRYNTLDTRIDNLCSEVKTFLKSSESKIVRKE